jgi:hypothetical protein
VDAQSFFSIENPLGKSALENTERAGGKSPPNCDGSLS